MIAAIDLGTSSVKVVCTECGKVVAKAKSEYNEVSVDGWKEAIVNCFQSLDASKIEAISLSSQVGTYIINDKDIVSWNSPAGKEELEEVKGNFSVDEFVREISMPHPDIVSYPVPRIMYAKKKWNLKSIYQPKDFILKWLTGILSTDIYSWRGLVNCESHAYSEKMLSYMGIDKDMLPPLLMPGEEAGVITESAAVKTGLKCGISVYAGCNDYYAGLLGMGILNEGDLFDVTGTSEHVGMVTGNIYPDTKMVSSPYFYKNVHYGVTASSGTSLSFGMKNFSASEIDANKALSGKAPLFLPYLKGERAPIWDSNARGVFFGINDATDKNDMAYSVLEGVAFSTYHIFESLEGNEKPERMVVSGGASGDLVLNKIKADLFGLPVVTLEEKDASAFGACIIASCSRGEYKDLKEATKAMCVRKEEILPGENKKLKERYELYKELYGNLKNTFRKFGRL